ncbi:MAG: hypothetical protein ACREGF_06610 [Candidatus Saccharimonadales bacterium]
MSKSELFSEPDRRENIMPKIEISKVSGGLGYGDGRQRLNFKS